MKFCPHCSAQFEDDFVFCLTDGNALVEGDGEVETVVLPAVDANVADRRQAFDRIACLACGTENRSHSRFCKKCGAETPHPAPPIAPWLGTPVDSEPAETVVFAPAIFTPPKAAVTVAQTRTGVNQVILLGAILGAIVVIGGLVIYSLQVGRGSNSDTPGSTSANKSAKSPPSPPHPDVGRTGRLTTNQRIRSAPTIESQILGVHYYNARIKVLDVTSYSTNEGIMLWYKVDVLQNGCDYEGIRGCGNDLNEVPGIAAMEGWTSAKNIQLD